MTVSIPLHFDKSQQIIDRLSRLRELVFRNAPSEEKEQWREVETKRLSVFFLVGWQCHEPLEM
jgi:hypothetical protein